MTDRRALFADWVGEAVELSSSGGKRIPEYGVLEEVITERKHWARYQDHGEDRCLHISFLHQPAAGKAARSHQGVVGVILTTHYPDNTHI